MTSGGTAAARLLSADAAGHPLADLPLDPAAVVAGRPTSALTELAPGVGVWELTAGTVTDVEVDETFVVVAGRGSLTFADGSVLSLAPGVVVALRAGDVTSWEVTEDLRKVWWT